MGRKDTSRKWKRKLHFGNGVVVTLKYMGDAEDLVKVTCRFGIYDGGESEYYRITVYRENDTEDMYDGVNTLLLRVNDIRKEYYAIPKEKLKVFKPTEH